MTVREALRGAQARLEAAGVPDARLDAEHLLASVLDAPRLLLRANGEAPLAPGAQAAFEALIARRASREPLQYILGTQEFMGLTLRVTSDALIPRADTETLCEQALLRLTGDMRVLDLCTGTGALAIALCVLGGARVEASDLSAAALALARENAAAHGADITFFQGDLFAPLAGRVYDMIVCNPPYIPAGALDALQREVLREPRMALCGGEDGLDFYRRLAAQAPLHLRPGGSLLLEVGDGQAGAVRALLARAFDEIAVYRDLAGLPRVVAARRRDTDAGQI